MKKSCSFFLCGLITLLCCAQNNPTIRIPIDIPIPMVPLVEEYRAQYLRSSGKRWLVQIMGAANPYRSYIRQKIAEYDLPECLEFLPVIESNFKPYAISKSGALGIWQFMTNSISEFNIRSNEWIDERRDPWLSTDAALKKLRDNYKYFKDWYLALAAYNCGIGAMNRAIKKGGMADFWYLSELDDVLKRETIHYVPKFLVIADLLTNASYYGIKIPPFDPNAHLEFDVFETNFAVDIVLLAEDIDCDPDLLRFYNPALNTSITPPDIPYLLRFPAAKREAVLESIEKRPSFIQP